MPGRPAALAFALALSVALAALPACKQRRTIAQATPEDAVTAFFAAIAAGHIPDRIEEHVLADAEVRAWRLRCASRGCVTARHAIVGRGEADYGVVLYVDYEVYGAGGDRVMKGTRSPFRLERDGDRWLITQIGEKRPGPAPRAPATAADAATPPAADAAAP